MRVFVLFAHPVPDSFSAALRDVAIKGLNSRGWEVDLCDLYKEGFNPSMSERERRDYHDESRNFLPVKPWIERLLAANGLVLVYPVWNFGYPAILKGFFDRVFLPGISFKLVDGKVRPSLGNIDRLAAVTTYGGTRLRAMAAGDPPRKHFYRSLRMTCMAKKARYVALYDMNRATRKQRKRFMGRVEQEMRDL